MSKALAEVMPETRHGLRTWHLMQNGIKHLGNLMKKGSYFLADFKKCMYDYDQEEKFEKTWSKLVSKFNVNENNWVKSMCAIKEKWAACQMKEAFTLGMRSTQLSESLNSDFKACMTPNINVTDVTFGILCCHALKVFEANDVKLVPEQYILKRWTRDARSGIIHDARENPKLYALVEDPKLSITQRYRQLSSTMIRLAADVSTSPTLYALADNVVHDLCKQVMEVRLEQNATVNDEGGVPTLAEPIETIAKGYKNWRGSKRQMRFKS